MTVGLFPTRSYMSASPSIIVSRMCSRLDGCEYCAFSHMIVGVSYHAGDCKCSSFPQMVVGVSYHASGCECSAFPQMVVDVPTMLVDVSAVPFLRW